MADRFIPLDAFISNAIETSEPGAVLAEPVIEAESARVEPEMRELFGEIRRFRAAVRDAVDVAIRALLCDVAAEVLARDLELAPANVQAIVRRACARYEGDGVVCVRVHPDEVAQFADGAIDVVADSGLRRGDALLQVRSGTIDVTLGARLAGVLDGVAP